MGVLFVLGLPLVWVKTLLHALASLAETISSFFYARDRAIEGVIVAEFSLRCPMIGDSAAKRLSCSRVGPGMQCRQGLAFMTQLIPKAEAEVRTRPYRSYRQYGKSGISGKTGNTGPTFVQIESS